MLRVTRDDRAPGSFRRSVVAGLALLSLATASLHAAHATDRVSGKSLVADRDVIARLQADTNGNRLFDNLEATLAKTAAGQPIEVVIRFREGCSPTAARLGNRRCERLPADRSLVARLLPAEITTMAKAGDVESIEASGRCRLFRNGANASFGTAKARADFGYTGDGDGDPRSYSAKDLTIAVIDTGIDGRHPDFAGGKIIGWKDFVNDEPEPYDDEGHGTHCASIAAGNAASGERGVAPGASLVGVKVMNIDGGTRSVEVAKAIDWCVKNKERYGIDIISISLGEPTTSSGRDVASRAVDRATAAGLVVCVAAGNYGPQAYSIGSPAAADSAITVGNMRDLSKGGFALENHSGRGPTADGRIKPDLCAPGHSIRAAAANRSGYRDLTGTSMSCPFVAGVAALMLEANPTLTPGDVKRIMKETAVHFGTPGENSDYGAGRLDGYAAIATAGDRTGEGPEVPAHLTASGILDEQGEYHTWILPVDDLRFPVAVALQTTPGLRVLTMEALDPNGRWMTGTLAVGRGMMVSFKPTRKGDYTLRVRSAAGAGPYWLDASAGAPVSVDALRLHSVTRPAEE